MATRIDAATFPQARHQAPRRSGHARLLLLRFAVVNTALAAGVVALAMGGHVLPVLTGDVTLLTPAIALLFLVGLAAAAVRASRLSAELDALAGLPGGGRIPEFLARMRSLDAEGRQVLAASLKLKLASRLAPIRHIATALVTLGLVGTVLGFMMALSGIDPERVADVSAIPGTVAGLMRGMATALNTTLVGAVLNIWLMIDVRLLEGAAVRLYTGALEEAERDRAARTLARPGLDRP